MVAQGLGVTAIEKNYCSSSPREQAATAQVLTFNSYVRLSLIVVAKAYTKGPGCRVLDSGYCWPIDIATHDNCFIFNILHKAADVKVPTWGPPSQLLPPTRPLCLPAGKQQMVLPIKLQLRNMMHWAIPWMDCFICLTTHTTNTKKVLYRKSFGI